MHAYTTLEVQSKVKDRNVYVRMRTHAHIFMYMYTCIYAAAQCVCAHEAQECLY